MGPILHCNTPRRRRTSPHRSSFPVRTSSNIFFGLFCVWMNIMPQTTKLFRLKILWLRLILPSLFELELPDQPCPPHRFSTNKCFQSCHSFPLFSVPQPWSNLCNALIQIFRKEDYSTLILCKKLTKPKGSQVSLNSAPFTTYSAWRSRTFFFYYALDYFSDFNMKSTHKYMVKPNLYISNKNNTKVSLVEHKFYPF